MHDFAITIRATRDHTKQSYQRYLQFLEKSNKQCKLTSYVFEENQSQHIGGYHMHGILSVPANYWRGRLIPKGELEGEFHIKLVKITNLEGWLNYMYKDYTYAHRVFNDVSKVHREGDYNPTDDDIRDQARWWDEVRLTENLFKPRNI